MSLFDKTTDALATSIAMRQVRQTVTQANIANAETSRSETLYQKDAARKHPSPYPPTFRHAGKSP